MSDESKFIIENKLLYYINTEKNTVEKRNNDDNNKYDIIGQEYILK